MRERDLRKVLSDRIFQIHDLLPVPKTLDLQTRHWRTPSGRLKSAFSEQKTLRFQRPLEENGPMDPFFGRWRHRGMVLCLRLPEKLKLILVHFSGRPVRTNTDFFRVEHRKVLAKRPGTARLDLLLQLADPLFHDTVFFFITNGFPVAQESPTDRQMVKCPADGMFRELLIQPFLTQNVRQKMSTAQFAALPEIRKSLIQLLQHRVSVLGNVHPALRQKPKTLQFIRKTDHALGTASVHPAKRTGTAADKIAGFILSLFDIAIRSALEKMDSHGEFFKVRCIFGHNSPTDTLYTHIQTQEIRHDSPLFLFFRWIQ